MEKLQPFEQLEGDYYLDNRDVWNSDDERGNESSDDEVRVQIEKLAGVKSNCRSIAKRKVTKDEFESDMDENLDEQFVHFASKKVFSSQKGHQSQNSSTCTVPSNDLQHISSESDIEMGKSTERAKIIAKNSILKTAGVGNTSSPATVKKTVTIAEKPHVFELTTQRPESDAYSECSSFSDKTNMLRKAADKMVKENTSNEVDFYDSEEDEDNERWVQQHREKLKLDPVNANYNKKKISLDEAEEKIKLENTDAVLSCPACMSLLTRDCQRHEFYRDQYRAMFVENCKIIEDRFLFLPQSLSKRKMKKTQIKLNTFVDKSCAESIPKEDLFLQVNCSICGTSVGVYDFDEVYHFFNVLAGYA